MAAASNRSCPPSSRLLAGPPPTPLGWAPRGAPRIRLWAAQITDCYQIFLHCVLCLCLSADHSLFSNRPQSCGDRWPRHRALYPDHGFPAFCRSEDLERRAPGASGGDGRESLPPAPPLRAESGGWAKTDPDSEDSREKKDQREALISETRF